MTKKIVLDVDGVLLNFIDKFKEVAEQTLKRKLLSDDNKYTLTERFYITKEEEKQIWKNFSKFNCWESLDPLPGVIEAIQKINELGFDIYIVTAIDDEFKEQRLKNLAKIGVIPKEIHCVGASIAKKDDTILKIKPDIFVDDRLEHLHLVQEVYHLVWVKDDLEQHNVKEHSRVDLAVSSLKHWVDDFLPEINQQLDEYHTGLPIQKKLRFI